MNVIYYFRTKFRISFFHAYLPELDCEKELAKGKYEGLNFPLIFKQAGGKKMTDIIDTGSVLYLISEKMKILLEENSLTGWRVFPIKLLDKNNNEIVGYHGFSVVGVCSSLRYETSKIIEKRSVPTGPICAYYKGPSVENWDGSDFFSPEKTAQILISEKAATLLKKNKITNLELINLVDFEINVNIIKK